MCEVVNINSCSDYILIMRPSKWGNPYSHKEGTLVEFKVNTRNESIDMYEKYLLNNQVLMDSLHELKYKKLGCICRPTKRCHGDILKKYVDRLEDLDKRKNLIDE